MSTLQSLTQQLYEFNNTLKTTIDARFNTICQELANLKSNQPSTTTEPAPNTEWNGRPLPTRLQDPATLRRTDENMRTYLKDAVATISKWHSTPNKILPSETVYRSIYNMLSAQTGFNVRHNIQKYRQLLGSRRSIIDMLCDLGYLDTACDIAYTQFGNKQQFVMAYDYTGKRRIDFKPVGRKADVKYWWRNSKTVKSAKRTGKKYNYYGTVQEPSKYNNDLEGRVRSKLTPEDNMALDTMITTSLTKDRIEVIKSLGMIAEQLATDISNATVHQDTWAKVHNN